MIRILLALFAPTAFALNDGPGAAVPNFPISPALDRAINVSATVIEGEVQVTGRSEMTAKGMDVSVLVPVTVHLPGEEHTYVGHFVNPALPSIGKRGNGRLDLDRIERIDFRSVGPDTGGVYHLQQIDSQVAVPMKVHIPARDVVGAHRFSVSGVKYRVRADVQSTTARVEVEK